MTSDPGRVEAPGDATGAATLERMAEAGLRMRHMEYFNLVGILDWSWSGRVRRRKIIPRRVGLFFIAFGEPSE